MGAGGKPGKRKKRQQAKADLADAPETEGGERELQAADMEFFGSNMAFANSFCSVDLSDSKIKSKKQRREEKAAARESAGEDQWAAQEAKKARAQEAKEMAAQIASKGSARTDKISEQVSNTLSLIPNPVANNRKRPGKRALEEEERLNQPEDYERTVRTSWKNKKGRSQDERELLPLKGQDGRVINQKPVAVDGSAAKEDEDEDEDNDDDNEISGEDEDKPEEEEEKPKKREKKKGAITQALEKCSGYGRVQQAKLLLAEAADSVLTSPEEHLAQLRDIIETVSDSDPVVKQYALATACSVIVDVLPGYSLKDKSSQEDPQKGLSKEVAERDKYEQALLGCYGRYLSSLKASAKGKSVVAQKSLRCLGTLLQKAQHFNLWSSIVKALVPRMCSVHSAIRSPVCAAVRGVFSTDYAGENSLQIVRELSRIAKAQPKALQPEMVSTLLALPLNTKMVDTELEQYEEKQANKKKKRLKKNKYAKVAAERELQRDLKMTAAEADAAQKRKTQTETLRLVFTVYFRVLKNSPEADVLPAVLAGVAKYAHLISIDFINDLMVCLEACMVDEGIGVEGRLSACLSVLRFVQAQGAVFNTDLKDVHTHLFGLMKELQMMPVVADDVGGDDDDDDVLDAVSVRSKLGLKAEAEQTAIDSLQLLLFNRAQMTESRAAGFIKLLSRCATEATDAGMAMSLTAVAHGLLERFSRTTQMLENDSSALGVYREDVDDPEYCNALAAKLWELQILTRHFHPLMSAKAEALLKQSKDSLQLMTPVELLAAYAQHDAFDLNPPMEAPKSRGAQKKRPLQQALLPEEFSMGSAPMPLKESPDFKKAFCTAAAYDKNRKLHLECRRLQAQVNAYQKYIESK